MKTLWLIPILMLSGCIHKRPKTPGLPNYKLSSVPLTPAHWKVEYDGGGEVAFNPDGSGDLVFEPQRARTSAQTFAALLLLKDTMVKPVKNYAVRFEATTVRQLRSSTPNDWEVLWFIGNYQKPHGQDKTANYFIAKPNSGVELGRIFEEVSQHFLKTTDSKDLQMNVRSVFYIVKDHQSFRVFRDGELVMDYEGQEMPEALYDHSGALGLYSEDALVRVHSFSYQAL
ncbi:MAG: hypothetical protein J7501_06175 [Bdellovibrio sp.]|nr:hypothetical protein [Bdellovibrio sp.]